MKTVLKNDKTTLFVPRILFENLKATDLHALFNDEEEIESLAKMLVSKANEYKFGGYVLEIYSQLGGHGKTQINHLVNDLAVQLHKDKKILILVIPPAIKTMEDQHNFDDSGVVFSKQDFYK
jgi:chitinase domain-containing protein 1